MKGPRPARMSVYGAGSKRLGRTEKQTDGPRLLGATAPGNSHCAPTLVSTRHTPPAIPIAPLHLLANLQRVGVVIAGRAEKRKMYFRASPIVDSDTCQS